MATLPTLTTTPVPAPVGSSDPLNQFLSTTCMDLLLIELVPLSKSLARNPLPQQDSVFLDTNPPTSIDLDDDSEREAIYFRLEPLGFRVGQGIAERFSRDRPRFTDTMDVIKFLCKDLWTVLFRKQIDNLKTNHRGVYVLTDNNFKWFSRMSTIAGGQDAINKAQPFLWFPCGLIRGALSNLGVEGSVMAEITPLGLPSVSFQIKVEGQ